MLFSTSKPKRRGSVVQTWLEIGSSLKEEGVSSRLRTWQLLCLAAIAYPTSLVVRWSASSTQYLLRLCLGLGRQPSLVYKGLNSFLLLKVQGEERMADLAKFVLRFAIVKITPEAFQLEETTGGQTHNGGSNGAKVGMDETAFATLSYYMVSEMPGTLAIVRYHARDDHDRTTAVAEDTFFDTPEDFCRLQDDVEDALLTGVDVCVMSNHPPETFEDINKYIMLNEDGDLEV